MSFSAPRSRQGFRKKRLGWRARYERELRERLGVPVGLEALTQRAVRCGLRQGLLRGADCMPSGSEAFDAERHATLGDVSFEEGPDGPYLDWTVLPAKKNEQQGKDEHVFLPKGDGVTDAYSAIKAMLDERRRLFPQEPPSAPLFILPSGRPYRVQHVHALFQQSAKAVGAAWEEMGAHSGRIGGATDLFAAGASPAVMQVAGRWVSRVSHVSQGVVSSNGVASQGNSA